VILAIGVGLVVWKKKVGGQTSESFNQITRQELEMLLADVAKATDGFEAPKEDPEVKKQQTENLKQLLASQAGGRRRPHAIHNKRNWKILRRKVDSRQLRIKRPNKEKEPMPAFGFISGPTW